MKHEIKQWLEQGMRDLNAAHASFQSGNFEWSSFQAQQAAEKALKALLLHKTESLVKAHDLVVLAKRCQASDDIIKKQKS